MKFAKDRKVRNWSLLVVGLGLIGLAVGLRHRPGAVLPGDLPDAQAAQLAGPKPGAMLMTYAIGIAFGKQGHDPNILEEPDVYSPVLDRLGNLPCWRYPFTYRTRTFLGGEVLHRGAIWVKDGQVIGKQWDGL